MPRKTAVDPNQFLPSRLREALRHVLADLAFPAARWQILTHAANWGVSTMVRSTLLTLPETTYTCPDAVLHALAVTYRPPTGSPLTGSPPSSSPPSRSSSVADSVWTTARGVRHAGAQRRHTPSPGARR